MPPLDMGNVMKLTAQSKQIIRDNRLQEFYLEAVKYLEKDHQLALVHYEIKRDALFKILKRNYLYFESISRPSKYLCVMQTTLMLYFGQFFAQSPLFKHVQEHLEKVILLKDKESKTWLEETIEYCREKSLSNNLSEIMEYAKKRYQAIGETPSLLKSEIDLFLLKDCYQQFPDRFTEKENFVKQAMKNINSMTVRRENIIFLCIVAQYMDGLNCFQDEFRPKWFGQLQFSGLLSWSFGLSP